MEVKLNVLDTRVLEAEATKRGLSLETLITQLACAEARRLWHISRSQPKEPVDKKFMFLASKLKSIFEKKKQFLGDELFDAELGSTYASVLTAIDDRNLAFLERVDEEAPWQKKW